MNTREEPRLPRKHVVIDWEVHYAAKKMASTVGKSLKDYVEDAIRAMVAYDERKLSKVPEEAIELARQRVKRARNS